MAASIEHVVDWEKISVCDAVLSHADLRDTIYSAFCPNPDFRVENSDSDEDYAVYVPLVKGSFNPVGVADYQGNLVEIMAINAVTAKEMATVQEEGIVTNGDFSHVAAYRPTIS